MIRCSEADHFDVRQARNPQQESERSFTHYGFAVVKVVGNRNVRHDAGGEPAEKLGQHFPKPL